MILVSGCLVGIRCRYDGRHSLSFDLVQRLSREPWVAVCPEQLGGLSTPRPPARLVGGDGSDVLAGRARVITLKGDDVTSAYVKGAEVTLDAAMRLKVTQCILKDRSPSCGFHPSVDEKGAARGQGVCAALLTQAGFDVIEVKAGASS
ncbi:MAG: DUF523 domain-containing protein [Deltaproteobacteria bacterium]|nr:DUF523 domain-containing protein [Deltaproteobacteria bacterium]MBW2142739.1 DUF523 domain-containing protein [Deltaproteobacteria bacterium]